MAHPVTKVLLKVLREQHDNRSKYVLGGGLNSNRNELAMNYNYVVGALDIIDSILTHDIIRDESLDGETDEDTTI